MNDKNKDKNSANNSKSSRKEFLLQCAKEFDNLYPDEYSHIKSLSILAGAKIFNTGTKEKPKCPNCKSTNTQLKNKYRLLVCKSCRRKTCITAGTFFQGIKKPMAWNMAIWFYKTGTPINAAELSTLSGIKISSASEILKKIALVVCEAFMNRDTLVSIHYFKKSITKRSLLTPALKRPSEELEDLLNKAANQAQEEEPDQTQEYLERGEENKETSIQEISNEISDEDSNILKLIKKEPTSLETLCDELDLPVSRILASLTVLELYGYITSLFGDRYCLKTKSEDVARGVSKIANNPNQNFADKISNSLKIQANKIVDFTREIFSGISRKYLQLYVALFWFSLKKREILDDEINLTFQKSAPVTHNELRGYNSPIIVTVPCSVI